MKANVNREWVNVYDVLNLTATNVGVQLLTDDVVEVIFNGVLPLSNASGWHLERLDSVAETDVTAVWVRSLRNDAEISVVEKVVV